MRAGWARRMAILSEFLAMVRDRKTYILLPLIAAIVLILLFMFVGEMPVLIPFFYAVF